jgi:2-keto-4-pentenoate hydratase/2-oxohepta-3-ene-1,7-dioic acid hydratase in catechol pathway
LLDALRSALAAAEAPGSGVRAFPAAEVVWRPPVRTPSKICNLALNNSSLDAIIVKGPKDHPAFFLKASTALIGHGDAVVLQRAWGHTHPEPELGVVIGHKLTNVAPSEVCDGIFGYTVMNDITGVGMREQDSFFFHEDRVDKQTGAVTVYEGHTSYAGRYKSSDTFAPCGPWIVTRDEIDDPDDLRVSCSIGDRLVADDSTSSYTWPVAEAIAQISRNVTLLPGDLVSMGTAVTASRGAREAHPSIVLVRLIDEREPMSVTIEKIGTLTNRIVTLP